MSRGTLQSILAGTGGLSLLLVAAIVLTVVRPQVSPDATVRRRATRLLAIVTLVQAVHFAEELTTGFHRLLPPLLGLAPWPAGFFVAFNLAWLAVWLATAQLLRRAWVPALTPAWFLALASVANGLAHPLLALRVGGYAPGLLTSPVTGVLGLALAVRLRELTARPATG